MLRQLRRSAIGMELVDLIPGDTGFGTAGWVAQGTMAQPYGHTVLAPRGFDPAQSLDRFNVSALGHELVHVLQRTVGRPGMCDNCTVLYSEMEGYIIQYAIEYDLATLPAERQAAKTNLREVASGRANAYRWLESFGGAPGVIYRLADETYVYGSGDWHDTLLDLGFSNLMVQHVDWILAQP